MRLITIHYPGGTTRRIQRDGLQRIETIQTIDASDTALMDYRYSFDPQTGNITGIDTELGDYRYGYDNLDRLTEAQYPDTAPFEDETFTYDPLGNRIQHSRTGDTEWLYNVSAVKPTHFPYSY